LRGNLRGRESCRGVKSFETEVNGTVRMVGGKNPTDTDEQKKEVRSVDEDEVMPFARRNWELKWKEGLPLEMERKRGMGFNRDEKY